MVQPSDAATPGPTWRCRDDVQTFGRRNTRRAGAAIEGAKRATLQFSLSRTPSSNLRSSLLKALSEKSARPASLSEFGRVELRSLVPSDCVVQYILRDIYQCSLNDFISPLELIPTKFSENAITEVKETEQSYLVTINVSDQAILLKCNAKNSLVSKGYGHSFK